LKVKNNNNNNNTKNKIKNKVITQKMATMKSDQTFINDSVIPFKVFLIEFLFGEELSKL
jgi:hypothetical protein